MVRHSALRISALAALCVLVAAPALASFPAIPKYFVTDDGPIRDTEYEACLAFTALHGVAYISNTFTGWSGNFSCSFGAGGSNVGRRIGVCPPNSTGPISSLCSCTTGYVEYGSQCVPSDPNVALPPKDACYPPDCTGVVAFPINVGARNKLLLEVDYVGASGLEFRRSYNSGFKPSEWNQAFRDSIGRNWTASYLQNLNVGQQSVLGSPPGVVAHRPDGKMFYFTLVAGVWTPPADVRDKLEKIVAATTTWRYTTAEGDRVETYDDTGKLLRIADRSGLTQTLTYSDATTPPAIAPLPGLLIRVTDGFGRQLNFVYDIRARISKMTDPAGAEYLYAYDDQYNLLSVTYPDATPGTLADNPKRLYHYENATFRNALTGITDENGDRHTTYAYDASGRPISSEQAGGVGRSTITYGGANSATVTDALNQARTYTFLVLNRASRNSAVSGPACPSCGPASSSYDANGNRASATDWNGNRTCRKYDTARNLETVLGEGLTGTCPADLSTWTPAAGTVQRKRTTQWHPAWRLPTKICEPKRITTLAYDAKGNMASLSVQATNDATGALGCGATPVGAARTWTYTYTYGTTNPAVATQIVVNGPRTDVTDATTYVHEEATGNLLLVTNALGHQTTFGNYDVRGKPRQIIDPNGLVTTLVWDERQRLSSRTVGSQLTSYNYDGPGQLTRITLPDASFIEYDYDAAHRITEVRDNLGNKVTYTLDLMSNRTVEETRDPTGVLRAKRSREYDTLNRLIKGIGGTNPALQITQYGYDNQGNLTSIDGPLTGTPNDLSTLTYDALNRLKDVTNPLSGLTRHGYDGLDQPTSVTDPRNNATGYTTSGLGDQTQEVSPDRGITNRLFDAAGNLTSAADGRPKTTTYTYDALNRLTQATFQDATSISYAWDQGRSQNGRLTTITFPGGNTTYTYDAHGRVTQKTDTHSTGQVFTVNYAWNQTTGRLTSITYPKGKVLTFGHDAAGRVTSLSIGSTIIATNIAYFPFGAPSGWTWGNSLVVARNFDLDGRLTSFPLSNTDLRNVTYDPASRITEIKHPTNSALVQTMGYDRLDRLTSWVSGTSTRSYGYDANGNRTTLTIGGSSYTYTTPPTTNRLGSTSGPSPARTFAYDGAGNTTGDGQFTLTYNDRGRLAQAVKGSSTVTNTYDGLGQRVKKTVGSGTTYFAYDEEGKLLGEYTSTGALIQEYVWLGTIPIAVVRGTTASPTVFYVYADQVDRPWVITNTANQLRWRWDTSPFGELAVNPNPAGLGSFGFNLRFPGQYRDAETGLFYNYFRDYDPQTGRFIQSDPIGLAGGINPYVYAYDSPIKYIDPRGLDAGMLMVAIPNPLAAKVTGDPYAGSLQGLVQNMRAPDYLQFAVDLYVFSATGTFSRSGNSFLGGGLVRQYPNPVSFGASVSGGWLNQCERPSPRQVDDFVGGFGMGFAGFYPLVGGGVAWSPGQGAATQFGFGVGFSVSPGSLQVNQGSTGLGGW